MTAGRSVSDLPPAPGPGEVVRGRAQGSPPVWWRPAFRVIAWGQVLGAVVLWATTDGVAALVAPGGLMDSLAMLLGLIATALALVQLALIARVPVVERTFGQGELIRGHRLVGGGFVAAMVAHVALVAFAHPADGLVEVVVNLAVFAWGEPTILLASIGTGLLLTVAATSMGLLRRRLAYERWHLLHASSYAGVLVAIPHQLIFGGALSTHQWSQWYVLIAFTVVYASILGFRLILPLANTWYYRPVVARVEDHGNGIVSVYVRGLRRPLAGLAAEAGQFFVWRFLDGEPGWAHGHPYSLSAAPKQNELRITIRASGGSRRWINLPLGTRVVIEGPYGRLTEAARTRFKVLLLAGGTGITPIRALLESLEGLDVPTPHGPRAVLIYRVTQDRDILFRKEIEAYAAARGIKVHYLIGQRGPVHDSWLPAQVQHVGEFNALLQLVPDLTDRDVYVCGPAGWMTAVERAARDAGVPAARLHLERFSW